jgi:SNF2-related domain
LYDYQEQAIERVVARRQQAVLIKMGLGKTVIALTALADLRVFPTLVFAPARVVELDVWGDETRQWNHLQHLRVLPVFGTALERLALLQSPADVYVLSYNNLCWFTHQLQLKSESKYKAIVFDELSRMKHPNAQWFKAARTWFKNISVRIGLTGTPVGNRLEDLWGEMYSVAGEIALGPSITTFRQKYFYRIPVARNIFKWEPLPASQAEVQKRIKPFAFTIDPQVGPYVPLVRVNEVAVELPQVVREQMKVFARQLRVELESKKELVACAASVVAGKLRQFASGAVILDKDEWEPLHPEKLRALDEILTEQQGDPVLCFYHYRHELTRMLRRYNGKSGQPLAQVLKGTDVPSDVKEYKTCTMEEWNSGSVELLLAHPQSSGFGLNLQHGGSTICWFTLPWSVELWEQAIARLARQGQRAKVVTVHVLQAGAVDRMVLSVLRNKGRIQSEVLEALSL